MKKPKVLVGCPVSDYHFYCTEEYIKAVKSLTYPNYNIFLVDNSRDEKLFKFLRKQGINVIKDQYRQNPRERIIESRNLLRQKVLEEGYDYFLSLEQDIIPPKDIIEKALSHNKDILTGVYCGNIKAGNRIRVLPLVYKYPQQSRMKEAGELVNSSDSLKQLKEELNIDYLDMVKEYYKIEELEQEKSPTKVHSCGLGCVLINRRVLESVKFRYSNKYGGWDDVWFCEDAKKNNFEIYVDPKIKCKHLIKNRPWRWRDLLAN